MKYCSECGTEIFNSNKFCSECGTELRQNNDHVNNNSIDKTVNTIDKNISRFTNKTDNTIKSIKNELNESEFVNNVIEKSISGIYKLIHFLGILGILVLLSQILVSLILGEETWLKQSYRNSYLNSSYWESTKKFTRFISFIMPSTILPLILICLASIKRKWFILVGIILLGIILMIST